MQYYMLNGHMSTPEEQIYQHFLLAESSIYLKR